MSDMRFELYHHLQNFPVGYLGGTDTGEILSRFANDLGAIENALGMAVVWGVLPGIDCLVGSLILVLLDWRLALLALMVWPWCLMATPRIARRTSGAGYARKEKEARVLDFVQESLAAHSLIRAYGLERYSIRTFLKKDAELFEASARMSFLTALMDQAALSGILLMQVITLAAGAYLAFHGALSVGTLAAFQLLYVAVSNSLLYFAQYGRSLLPARAGMSRVQELLRPGNRHKRCSGCGSSCRVFNIDRIRQCLFRIRRRARLAQRQLPRPKGNVRRYCRRQRVRQEYDSEFAIALSRSESGRDSCRWPGPASCDASILARANRSGIPGKFPVSRHGP